MLKIFKKYFIQNKNNKKNNSGFSIVEVVIAIAIALMLFSSIYSIIFFSNQTMHRALRKTEAVQFAQEGIEIVRTIKNVSWTDDIATLTSGTVYYPVLVGDLWTLSTISQPLINGTFTRTISIYAVNRDANDDIAVVGTDDPKTKRVVVTVSWVEKSVTNSVVLETYLTNFLNN